jgi:hypothetical protein
MYDGNLGIIRTRKGRQRLLRLLIGFLGFMDFPLISTTWIPRTLIDINVLTVLGVALSLIVGFSAIFNRLKVSLYTAAIFILFISAVYLDKAADNHPPIKVQSHLIQKFETLGPYGPRIVAIVSPSWRLGRTKETLEISRDAFNSLIINSSVVVTVHPGAIGLPWGPSISMSGN